MLIGNYAKYSTFESLWRVVTAGVLKEWLENKELTRLLTVSLRSVWLTARANPRTSFSPKPENCLEVLKLIRPSDVKVVITAQDPYPRLRDAMGIAFHSPSRGEIPFSASMINSSLVKYKHINPQYVGSANYIPWVKQGVLLINMAFTCVLPPKGHRNYWRKRMSHFTHWKGVADRILRMVPKDVVAVLLGEDAKSMLGSLNTKHIVAHVHPATRRANDFLSKDVFGEVNELLENMGKTPIDWTPGV